MYKVRKQRMKRGGKARNSWRYLYVFSTEAENIHICKYIHLFVVYGREIPEQPELHANLQNHISRLHPGFSASLAQRLDGFLNVG